MNNSEQNTQVQGRAKARRTALIVGLIALAVYGGFFLTML
jgi:hypothetical protein